MPLARPLALAAAPALLTLLLAPAASAAPLSSGSASAQCTGDTLSVQVRAAGATSAALLAGHDQGHLTATGLTQAVPASGVVRFDLAGLGARHYRVQVTDARGAVVARSQAVPAASCAPGHEVPEVPVAALAPGSLLLTAGVLLLRRRRAAGA